MQTQREILFDILKEARKQHAWLSLDELYRMTGYNPASISAQLRHLRKMENGAHMIHLREREANGHFRVYEYLLGAR